MTKERSNDTKILTVFGTRPEVIKLAPVIREIRKHPQQTSLTTCATAQHREMLDQMLETFRLVPDVDLGIMTPDQSASQVAAAILRELPAVLRQKKIDWVVVQGDTTTAATAALCAFYEGCKVAHVEAGLRTQRAREPFPEEMNRRLISTIADLHFAPTGLSRQNLLACGVDEQKIAVTGNTVIDALQWIAAEPAPETVRQLLTGADGQKIVLVTAHRRENIGQPLSDICEAIKALAERFSPAVRFMLPVHLNPNVSRTVNAILAGVDGVDLLPPLEYATFVHLLKRVEMVLTDSGGLQEEATAFSKPAIVLRNVSDRPEAVEAGCAKIVGTKRQTIIDSVGKLLSDADALKSMSIGASPYGEGQAAEKIVLRLLKAASIK